MYTIIEHIEYLMMSHDCVVIPGWGAIVAQYSDSSYNPSTGCIERPQRILGFNASVAHNDGLLAQSIVRREGVTYADAMRHIDRSVSAFRQQLRDGDEVALGRLGFFQTSDEGRIEFTPYYQAMGNDIYYGLLDIPLRPLAEQEPIVDDDAPTTVHSRRFEQGLFAVRRYSKIAASIAVLLCLSLLLTTPIIINRENLEYASLNLPHISKPQHQDIDWSQTHSDLTVGLPAHEVQASNQENIVNEQHENGLMLDEGGNCYLIISTLTSPEQVASFKRMHAELASKMQVMKTKGRLHRVYVARSDDPSHLLAVRKQLPPGFEDAWIYQ